MSSPEFLNAGLEHLRVIADRNYPIGMILLEDDGTTRHAYHSVIDPLSRQLTYDEYDHYGVQNSVFVREDDQAITVTKTTTSKAGLQASITYNRADHTAIVFLARYPNRTFLVTETIVRDAETGRRVDDIDGVVRAMLDSYAQDAEINLSHEALSQGAILYEAPFISIDTNKNTLDEQY